MDTGPGSTSASWSPRSHWRSPSSSGDTRPRHLALFWESAVTRRRHRCMRGRTPLAATPSGQVRLVTSTSRYKYVSLQVRLVISAQCRRGDCGCGGCAKGRIEGHRERRHGGALGVGEHVTEHATRHVVRVRQCITEARNDGAATIFAGEPRTPDVCRLGRNDCGNTSSRRRGIFPIVTKLALETDKVAERLPELLFERRRRQHPAVLRGV